VTATETSTITPTVTVTETSTVTATVTQTVTPPTPESKPDLIIQDITWSPKNPGRGDTVTFTITLTNPGKAQAAASYVAYYIDGVFQDTISVYSIDSGATRKVSFTWKAELGNHTIKALADFNDTVAESDDTNNEKEIYFSETVAADLIIQDITWTPEIITQNEETVFSLTIINQGNGGAGSFYIHLYNDGSSESHVEVVRLLAGETATVIIRWDHYPVPDKGIHSMMFIADTYNYVPESDETNNSETIMITVS
jgi:subtilase family serine protease